MQLNIDADLCHAEFDGVDDMVAALRPIKPQLCEWATEHDDHLSRASFLGRTFASWDEVFSEGQSIWSAGVEIIDGMRREIESAIPAPVSRARRRRWSQDNGDEVCIDRLRSGQDFWRESHRTNVAAPQNITVVTSVASPVDTDPSDVLWRGAAAIAMVQALEAAGYRCDLLATHYSTHPFTGSGRNALTTMWLKRSSETLDIASLAAVVSGWFYRTGWFGSRLLFKKRLEYSMGSPGACPDYLLKRVSSGPWLRVTDAFSRWDAVQCVRQQIARLETLTQEAA